MKSYKITSFLTKTFSLSNCLKILTIFTVGLITRFLVSYSYDVNVFTDYLNNISLFYYLNMAIFSKIINALNFNLSNFINFFKLAKLGFSNKESYVKDIIGDLEDSIKKDESDKLISNVSHKNSRGERSHSSKSHKSGSRHSGSSNNIRVTSQESLATDVLYRRDRTTDSTNRVYYPVDTPNTSQLPVSSGINSYNYSEDRLFIIDPIIESDYERVRSEFIAPNAPRMSGLATPSDLSSRSDLFYNNNNSQISYGPGVVGQQVTPKNIKVIKVGEEFTAPFNGESYRRSSVLTSSTDLDINPRINAPLETIEEGVNKRSRSNRTSTKSRTSETNWSERRRIVKTNMENIYNSNSDSDNSQKSSYEKVKSFIQKIDEKAEAKSAEYAEKSRSGDRNIAKSRREIDMRKNTKQLDRLNSYRRK